MTTLNFEVLCLTFANFSRLTAVKPLLHSQEFAFESILIIALPSFS